MRTKPLQHLLLTVVSILSFATAWDGGVHQQIGYIAEQFLTSPAKAVFKEILGNDFNGSIGQAAAWADGAKWTSAPYSGPWHFLNTHDYPPERCSVNYTADCVGGSCAVQQIHNQTSILEKCVRQVMQRKYVDDINCRQALKWVVHIVADLCQPLHVSSGKGGSNVTVKYNGSTSFNMHQVWDGLILYSAIGLDNTSLSIDRIVPYFQQLHDRIARDDLYIPRKQWAMCEFEISRGPYCAERWAQDTNPINCDYVYKKPYRDVDLVKSSYAADAFPIVELQLAKAAWRLAGWLNAIIVYNWKSNAELPDIQNYHPGPVLEQQILGEP